MKHYQPPLGFETVPIEEVGTTFYRRDAGISQRALSGLTFFLWLLLLALVGWMLWQRYREKRSSSTYRLTLLCLKAPHPSLRSHTLMNL